MTGRTLRRLGALALALLAVGAAAGGGAASERAGAPAGPRTELLGRSLAERISVLRPRRLAQSSVVWRGGAITASTGEVVNVVVSESFTPEQATPEIWAEFLVHLVHGTELQRLTLRVAPLAEVRELCGLGALGCYARDEAIAIGETLPDGTTPEEVIRHEYGHHVALYRSNSPWSAIDWGPKRWATAAGICARTARSEAFPGDEDANYMRNPGEAWAEVYRLMDERKAGVTTASWNVVAPAFYPGEAQLQAAEQDVVSPWTGGLTIVKSRRLARRGQTWWIPLVTPLDGSLLVRATVPSGGRQQVALFGANRRTVLRRAQAVGRRGRLISTNVCGQRSLYVRVTQQGAAGRVAVTITAP